MKRFIISFALIFLLLSGCALNEVPADSVFIDPPQLMMTEHTDATLIPTPKPTSTPTPQPTSTPKPTPTLTPTPKPTPAPESERVDIAEDFYYIKLNDEIKERITGISYPAPGEPCRISYDDLRYIHLLHYDFDGNVLEGELIVHRLLAREVTEVFYELYLAEYPMTSVILVDEFGEKADDNLSMAANNTSAFNYRYVSGSSTLSLHSYGAAIDINPLYNPYIVGERVAPPGGAPYVDRTQDFPGKIDHDDLAYQLLKARGWSWGGDWTSSKDYQHFSKDIR